MIITGYYNKENGYFVMHAPQFPYNSLTYIGYTLNSMKKKYRATYGLQGKHIEWLICGLG